jgi:UDP-N-acetylmuramoyl-tripeptide--D-alanyl-D-alanine ligase
VVRKLRDGIVLVDDSYNSSPAALRQALATVAASATSGGRVAVIGEMLELGRHADALHAECGRVAAASGLRALVAVGGSPAQHLAAAAVASGMAHDDVRHFETSVDAAPDVVRLLRPGDLLLVKGSRGTRCDVVADRVVEAHG